METVIEKQLCTGCHACFNACPVRAIRMEEDEEGFLYPLIDPQLCVDCGKCQAVCPVLTPVDRKGELASFACYAQDQEVHQSSSSGGVFALLAREVLAQGGYVCGAAFDRQFCVAHVIINDLCGIDTLKGSKYVQSKIGDVYREVEDKLKTGKTVLFSGTSCQVGGLKSYLGKDYEHLLTVDLVCHGVPSPGVWRAYLSSIAKNNKVVGVSFRNKSRGIHEATLDYSFENGSKYQEKYNESPYIKGFLKNLTLRPSCFECRFKGVKRCSDLTIGDFWAVKEFHPDMDNEQGVSAVIVHTKNGLEWFRKINGLTAEKTTAKKISCWNENLLLPAFRNSAREDFFRFFHESSVINALDRFAQEGHLITPPTKKQVSEQLIGALKKWLRS